MTRFRYWTNAPFLLGCCAYVINRWLVVPHVGPGFLRSHFDDLWLIPCALPPLLWLHRQCGLRSHDQAPQPGEIIGHLIFWSLLLEGIGPRFVHPSTGDAWDVGSYAAGALASGLWWHRQRFMPSSADHEL
ncbi:MAG: hypothetical protein JWO08_33 [Verrucomicrobiaceae bacterium]|nr:hypothetical protein [Verrucomicrobiaceae bacterium]